MSSASRLPVLAAVLFAAVALYFVNLGVSSIWDANEAFYVETPREMIESGDYVSPTFNYEPRLNKPVLSYWIVAAFYHVFGISVGVQRIPIALSAVVMMASAYVLAALAWPVARRGASGALMAGLWAALGLAIAPRVVMFARRILIDMLVSMFMALTLTFFALAERYPEQRRLFLILMYVAVGFGVLTKGPAFALLPGLVFAIYLLVHWELRRATEMLIPQGVLIVSAIVVPWYLALYVRHGWTYIVSFVVGENFARYAEGAGVNATRGFSWYLPVVFSDSFPWSVFLIVAAAAWFSARRAALPGEPGFRVRTLLWIWIAAIVGFFSLSEAKQDLYIFPIVPAVAALGGLALCEGLETSRRLGVRLTVGAIAVLIAALGVASAYLFWGSGAVYAVRGPMLIGVIALAGAATAMTLAVRDRAVDALLAVAVTITVLNWTFVLRVLPSFEPYKPAPAFARILSRQLQPGDVVATYNVAIPSLVYYLKRHVDMAYDPAPIRHFLESGSRAFVIASRPHYEEVLAITSAETCIVATQPTFDVKLRNILAREAPPELLLITNRCR